MLEYENPLVSVVVPVYNVEDYMKQCVESLIHQTLKNVEIILVDDGSTDKSPAICDGYAEKYPQIKVIHKQNGGLGSARNAGMQIAKGKYVGFVDSDDYVSEKMYETLLDLTIVNDADCAYCNFLRFWGNKAVYRETSQKEIKIYSENEILNPYLLDRIGCKPADKDDCSYGASVGLGLFKKEVLDKSGILFVSERELIAEDMIFDIDFIPHCTKIVHTNETLYFYRFNPHSLTTSYVPDRFEKNAALCEEMRARLSKVYDSDCYEARVDRYFLKIVRIALIEEINHKTQNGWKTVRKNMSRIACNKQVEQILESYPIYLLPMTQRIFFGALKRKMYLLIAAFIKANSALKRNG